MKKFIIEQIENGIARCENEEGYFENIELSQLPKEANSGDVVAFENGAYKILADETQERKNKMLELQKKLFGRKK